MLELSPLLVAIAFLFNVGLAAFNIVTILGIRNTRSKILKDLSEGLKEIRQLVKDVKSENKHEKPF